MLAPLTVLFQTAVEGAVADAQLLSGLLAIAIVAVEGFLEHLFAELVEIKALRLFLGLYVFLCLGIFEVGRDGLYGRDRR